MYFKCVAQCEPNPIPEPFTKAAEMENMEHVHMFMNVNEY